MPRPDRPSPVLQFRAGPAVRGEPLREPVHVGRARQAVGDQTAGHRLAIRVGFVVAVIEDKVAGEVPAGEQVFDDLAVDDLVPGEAAVSRC